jgi:ribosomal protein S18 acetylase RimI-like enzyme
MKIIQLPKKDKKITSQFSDDWRKVDKEHFGQTINEWKTDKFFLYVSEDNKAIGYVDFEVQMGVCHVREIVVKEDHRRKGVGKKLMRRVEDIARKKSTHKIYLTTGIGWKERKFYEDVGFKKVADLKNHFLGTDFIYLAKEI